MVVTTLEESELNDAEDVGVDNLPNINGAMELDDGVWNKLTPAEKLLSIVQVVVVTELGLPNKLNDSVLEVDTADE